MRIAEIMHRGEVQFVPNAEKPRMIITAPGGVEYIVLDGEKGKECASINHVTMAFSPDSARFVYRVDEGEPPTLLDVLGSLTQRYVLDGMEGKSYNGVREFTFSADSKRTFYKAEKGKKWLVVIDGVEGKEYDFVYDLVFSPDRARVAYEAERGKKHLVVVDGVEGAEYDSVDEPIFSSDGKRVAYEARRGKKDLVVVDGVEGKEYDAVRGVAFSPDGLHVTYSAYGGGRTVTVRDGVESTPD